MKSQRFFQQDLLAALISSAQFSLFLPQYMVAQSPDSYAFIDHRLLLLTGLVALFFCLGLFLVFAKLADLLKQKKIFRCINMFLFFWILNAGFLFPVASSVEMVDPEKNPINFGHLVLLVMLSSAMLYVVFSKFSHYLLIYVMVFLIATVAPVLPRLFDTVFVSNVKGEWVTTLSAQKNILVISFDGIPGNIAEQLIAEQPEFQSEFKDFTFFSNTIAPSPGTYMSILSELYGHRDYKAIATTEEGLEERLDSSQLLINQYAAAGHDVYTYGPYNSFNNNPETRIQYGHLHGKPVEVRLEEILNFYSYVVVRVGSRYALKAAHVVLSPFRPLVELFGHTLNRFEQPDNSVDVLASRLDGHHGPDWDKVLLQSADDYTALVDNLAVGSSSVAVRYMHFTHTHFPVDFDQDCVFRGDDKAWYEANQNQQGAGNETICALKQLAGLMQRLRALDLYQHSLIILKSDHGKVSDYYEESPYHYRFNGHDRHGYGRYRPMLMIKGFNTENQNMRVRAERVLLDDLAITLCQVAELKMGCEEFPGVNLMQTDLPASREFNIYVVRDTTSDHRYDTHIRLSIPANKSLLEYLKQSNKIGLSK